jgi:hypothetical protein
VGGALGLGAAVSMVDLSRRLIAWRLQVELFGGLDAETTVLLRRTSIPRPLRPQPHGLVADVDAVLEQQVLDVAQRQAGS